MKIQITLAFAARERQKETVAEVPTGTTFPQGLALLREQITVLLDTEQAVSAGVWGKPRPAHYVLREGDRIEFYRPLKTDPKQARRARGDVTAKRR